MKLTTKRNRRYFWRELFLYMIPMLLIVGTVDVFYHFVQCPLHPEYSAPCSVNWFLAVAYGSFLLITIIFAIISAKMLRKIKRQIEDDFLSSVSLKEGSSSTVEQNNEENEEIDNKKYNKKRGTMKMIENNKHEEDDNFEKGVKSNTKKVKVKSTKTKKDSVKRKIAKNI